MINEQADRKPIVTNADSSTSAPDFRQLFQSVPGLYLVLVPDLTIIAVSDAYLHATMTQRETILARNLFDVFPDNPDDPTATGVQNLRASLERVLKHGVADTMALQKYDIRQPESQHEIFEERYWSVINSPVFGSDGKIIYLVHRVEDVTEFVRLKQAGAEQDKLSKTLRTRVAQMEAEIHLRAQEEQQAREAEAQRARLYSLFMQAPVAIAIFRGPAHVIELANELHLQIWGRSAEDVLNKPMFDALPEARGQGYEELLAGVLRTGNPYIANEHSARLIRNGQPEMVYFNFVFQPLREVDGTISGVIVIANEITEQVRARQIVEDSEQRQLLALHAAQMGVWDLDLVHNTAVRTLRHDQIFGYDSIQMQWDADLFFQHVVPQDQAYAQQCFATAFKSGYLNMECRIRWQDGSIHWIDAQGQVYYDAAGTPVRMLGVVIDITERKELESRRDEFLSVASHELKTPVTAIKGMTELLLRMAGKRDASERELRALNTVNQQVDRMTRLVNDMLDVSRIAAGKLVVSLEAIDLCALLSEVVEQEQFVHTTHTLTLEPCAPCIVRGNHDRLQQVVLNLLANAVQHSPLGSAICIMLHQDADQVTVSVRDTGVGISKEKQAHLFERFYQAQENPARGLGLGLYIVKEIIEQHHGRIWVESESGYGSTFSFSLPKEKRNE